MSPEEKRRRDVQADINRQLRRWTPRQIIAWSLFVLAGVIAVQHIFAHLGFQALPLSLGYQDLFVGYPMAGLVLVLGAMTLERKPS